MSKPKCLETRRTPEGLVHRRYRTVSGRDFWTVEMPEPVYRAAKFVVAPRMESLVRAEGTRERLAQAKAMLLAGEKQVVVAEVLGMTRGAVAQFASRQQAKGDLPRRGRGGPGRGRPS